jgi:hypothetical protein
MTDYLIALHAGTHGTDAAAIAITLGLAVASLIVAVITDRRRPEPLTTQPPPRTETTR